MSKASTYSEFLNDAWLSKWQPRQVLQELIELDQRATVPMAISVDFGENGEENWITLGPSQPITLKQLNKAHNSLGYFLHASSVAQMEADGWFERGKANRSLRV